MKTFQSTPITFIDQTDSRKLEVYITSNLPTVQIYNQNKPVSEAYTPDWTEGEKLVLSMDVFLDSRAMTTTEYNGTAIKWYKNDVEMTDGSIEDISDDKRKITIKDNILKDNPIITYTCEAEYQGIKASTRVTFTRVDTGRDGEKGADGTSVRILGNAKSVAPVANTSYYTITYDAGAVIAAALGDAYVYSGELYVCSILNGGQDGKTDYFVNVGAIQGEAAKSLALLGNAQVFHIDKENKPSPSTIDVTAHTVNFTDDQKTSIKWEYRTTINGTWSNITSGMVSMSNNVVKIDGNTFRDFTTSDFISIRATFEDGEETYQDVFTVYKTFDGTDGNKGNPGDDAPIVFLSNEHISFVADANGETYGVKQSIPTNVVAYSGTTKVEPQINLTLASASLPEGMSISIDEDTMASIKNITPDFNEIILKVSVDSGVNLGSALSNNGMIPIQITSPANVVLQLNWTKVNAGPEGEPGVGIEDIYVDYGSSKTSDVKVEDISWDDEIPVVPEGEYLWTRTTINYTDSKKQDTVTYTYVQQGKKGDTGTFVNDVDIQYVASSNATTPPSEGWSTAVVATTTEEQYLWTKTIFKLSDGTAGDPVYSVAKQGVDGSNFRTFTTEYETNQTSMEVWSKMESSEWNVNESTSGTKVGDTVMLRCYNTTKQGYSYILATVISIPGDKVIHAKSMGLLDKGDAGIDANTVLLTNESHVFAGDISNAIAGEASTQIMAYIGAMSKDVTIVSVDGVNASTSVTNTKTTGLTFQCDKLTGASPKITFKCTTSFTSKNGTIPIVVKVGNLTFTKMFTYSIAFKGNTGNPATAYWLVSSASVVQKTATGTIAVTPSTLTFTGKSQTGTNAPADYAGRWIVAYSTDGTNYTNLYTSTANETSKSITVATTYKTIRARMYLAGGTTTLLDEQIIPIVSDGATGGSGTPASLVDITPSALYFKSTTGATGTFDPQYIYLYPRFQSATYSNWQYSRDGGVNWTSVSGANGITVATYNSVANSLRIDRASTLYTDTITSISFKCNSATSGVYDTVSIAKIYDVVDLQIGGTNLIPQSKMDKLPIVWAGGNGFTMVTEDGYPCARLDGVMGATIAPNINITDKMNLTDTSQEYTVSAWVKAVNYVGGTTNPFFALYFSGYKASDNTWLGATNIKDSGDLGRFNNAGWSKLTWTLKFDSPMSRMLFYVYLRDMTGTLFIRDIKVEKGNTPSDWSPAPEDLIEEAANVNVMLSNEAHFFEATAGGIPTDASVTLDVIGYKGSVKSATTVGAIIGVPSAGMTTTITNNGTTNTKLTIKVTSALTSAIADYGILTIPITVNGHTINKIFNWTKAKAGDIGAPGNDSVTFQVYSNNGYALSTNVPTLTLQTFAYIGDVEIQADATYQWYRHNNTDWVAISGATNSYFNVSRDDVSFSNNYMCKMQFGGKEYVGVVTIEDKNDENKVFASKPSNYFAGDLWIVGTDYIPSGFTAGTMLRAEQTNPTYRDADWVSATKYDEEINNLKGTVGVYQQYFSVDSTNGLRVGDASIKDNTLKVERINTTTIQAKNIEVESPLTVTGRYSGSTMLQAPILNLGNFSLVIESNGSLSVVSNS